jgi:excisionase family DNA binding protein
MNENKLLTVTEVARMLQMTHQTIQKWCSAGLLKAYRTAGKHYRIKPKDLRSFVEKYNMYMEE